MLLCGKGFSLSPAQKHRLWESFNAIGTKWILVPSFITLVYIVFRTFLDHPFSCLAVVVIIFMRKRLNLKLMLICLKHTCWMHWFLLYCSVILDLDSVPFLYAELCAEFTCLNTRNIPGISKTMKLFDYNFHVSSFSRATKYFQRGDVFSDVFERHIFI